MPTNANTFNSRVTSEALEKKFRDTFPAQGGAELIQDLYAQGTIVPVVDFTSAAEGSQLGQNLQTAWDFSTGFNRVANTTTTLINNTGFWQVDLNAVFDPSNGTPADRIKVQITDGLSSKTVWSVGAGNLTYNGAAIESGSFVVFLRAGDSLTATSAQIVDILDIWYRQIADVSGNLVNPLGFTSS